MNDKVDTAPRQAWAHKDGRVALLSQGEAQDTGNVLDRLKIQEAFGRFGIAHDEARFEVLESLFTEDALFEVAEGGGNAFVSLQGRKAISDNFKVVIPRQSDQRRHCFSNIVLERLTDDEAHALAFGIVTRAADGLSICATVFYVANLRKGADDAWRFSRFFIGMDDYREEGPRQKK